MQAFEPTEDLEDKFQEYFFEALRQKAIENYELALTALDKAELVAGSKEKTAVVFFEKGKNHALLRDYVQAESFYKQVLASEGDRQDVLEHLYDLYYKQQDFDKALPVVQKLISYHDDYKEDLVNLYVHTKKYDEALALLKELESIWGESDIRNALKAQIYRLTGDTAGAIEEIEQKIDDNPGNEKEYLNLIFLYSEQGDKEKAFETAQQLLQAVPNSKMVHLALYKFYIEKGKVEEAVSSMKIIFSTDIIDDDTVLKVLHDFIAFVETHQQYQDELESVANQYSKRNPKVFEFMGNYYLSKNLKVPALEYYEKGVAKDPENYSLLKNTLLLQLDNKNFSEADKLSAKALSFFPAQPLLYLIQGVANNGLNKHDQAIEALEMGIDFVLDDAKMEKDFYEQLSIAYRAKGNLSKADHYANKATKIILPE